MTNGQLQGLEGPEKRHDVHVRMVESGQDVSRQIHRQRQSELTGGGAMMFPFAGTSAATRA